MSSVAAVQEVFDQAESSLEELIACIEAAQSGDFMRRPSGRDTLSVAISRLLDSVEKRCGAELSNVVDISVTMNETSVKSANLLHDLRGVDRLSQSIASAAEEMATTVGEIEKSSEGIFADAKAANQTAASSAAVSARASDKMDVISTAVAGTNERIDVMQKLAHRIEDISQNIRKIASQTNLLAINAAVEAARAGDAGKGFAVVAAEVKTLSDKTTSATEEIANIVGSLKSGTESMVAAMIESSNAAAEGKKAVTDLDGAINDIGKRIREMADASGDITSALRQQRETAEHVAQNVAAAAENSRRGTQALEGIIGAMDAAQKTITSQIARISSYNLPNKVILLAQSDHVIWKKRLANMVIGREGLNPFELADHRSCRLGKWYYQVDDPNTRAKPAFQSLEEPHALVHKHGIEAVRLYNNGDINGALQQIALVEDASRDVLLLLKALER